jgi:hypothetical protein
MARSSSPRPDGNDCLRLPATSSPRIRGAEKKESTGLRLNQPCPPYVTPSSISSFGRRLSSALIAESKSLKNSGENKFCQSSARHTSRWSKICVRSHRDVKKSNQSALPPHIQSFNFDKIMSKVPWTRMISSVLGASTLSGFSPLRAAPRTGKIEFSNSSNSAMPASNP